MGNIIGWMNTGVVAEGTLGSQTTLWDMISHLVTQYIFSKVEQDEFLREYLVGNIQRMNFLTMGQRALTFKPLPSRIEEKRGEKNLQEDDEYEVIPKEVPYTRVRFEELEEEEVIYIEENYSSSDSEEEVENVTMPGIELYSAYNTIVR